MRNYTGVLTYSLCELHLQMPFLQSCKSAACGFVSCCDRQPDEKSDSRPRYPASDFSNAEPPPSKRSFNRLRPWPPKNTQRVRWKGARATHQNQQFANESYDRDKASSDQAIAKRTFTYNTILYKPAGGAQGLLYRRLRLDFQVVFNAVSDQIPPELNLNISPYYGPDVRLPNGYVVTPVGELWVKWKLLETERTHETLFLVIKDSTFDVLLGRASIQEYKLWEEDKDILKRLEYRD
ncbi:hypothetical protein BJY04DRAFT_220794 [Aspergillus karnatakaensis]|uniref:uncharacterized protein n=1 Tax=Aspergillus karnatakaensis TaxID=1810916 RepID=UPI003CCD3360